MNQLNSLIIEGSIFDVEIQADRCDFSIENIYDDEQNHFDCFSENKSVISGLTFVKKGDKVRIVGRIVVEKEDIDDREVCSFMVKVEHVDFKGESQ